MSQKRQRSPDLEDEFEDDIVESARPRSHSSNARASSDLKPTFRIPRRPGHSAVYAYGSNVADYFKEYNNPPTRWYSLDSAHEPDAGFDAVTHTQVTDASGAYFQDLNGSFPFADIADRAIAHARKDAHEDSQSSSSVYRNPQVCVNCHFGEFRSQWFAHVYANAYENERRKLRPEDKQWSWKKRYVDIRAVKENRSAAAGRDALYLDGLRRVSGTPDMWRRASQHDLEAREIFQRHRDASGLMPNESRLRSGKK